MKHLLAALCFVFSLNACADTEQLEEFTLVPLQVGDEQILVQLADTPERRAQGLMYQQSADPGMLLLYPRPTEIALWMANTAMALDVAYIGPDWQIVQLIQLAPFDKTAVPSPGPVIAALEMPRGWFASHGIKVGAKAQLLPTP